MLLQTFQQAAGPRSKTGYTSIVSLPLTVYLGCQKLGALVSTGIGPLDGGL